MACWSTEVTRTWRRDGLEGRAPERREGLTIQLPCPVKIRSPARARRQKLGLTV